MFKKLLLAVVGVAIIAGVGFAADPQAPTMPFYWVNGVVKNPEKLGGRDLYVYAQNYGTGYLRVAVDAVTGAFRFNVYELKYYHNNDNWMEVGGKPVFIMSVVRKWGGADPLNYGTSEISSVNWAKGYIDADLELVLNGGPNDFSGGQIAGYVSDEATKQMISGAGLAETPVGAKATTANDGTYMFADTFDTNSVHNVAASKTGYETGMVMDLTVKPTKVSWANFALKTGGIVDTGLYIKRDGDSVNDSATISWDPLKLANPTIWMLTGAGNGVYTDVQTNWQKVYEGGAVTAAFASEFSAGSNSIIHLKQVGAGYAEVYYKAVAAGGVFATSPAVGKVNVPVAGGKKWTLFNSPFLALPGDPNLVLGKQGQFTPGSEPATSVRIFSFENSGWNRVSYYDGNTWAAVPGANAAISDPQQGLYLLTKSADTDKIFSIVGNVKPLNSASAYSITENWNVLGMPYPRQMDINSINLKVGKKNDNWELADRVYGRLNNGFNTCSFLKADGTWAPQPGVTGVDVINATPLYYRSRTVTPLNWNLTPSVQGYN